MPNDDLDAYLDPLPKARERPSAPTTRGRIKFQPPESDWSLSRLPEIESGFQKVTGVALPVRVRGQGSIHDKWGWSHDDSADVGLNPNSKEGQALMTQLRERNIPFLAFSEAIPGVATGPHIHIGRASRRKGSGQSVQQSPGDLDKYLDPIDDYLDKPVEHPVTAPTPSRRGARPPLPASIRPAFSQAPPEQQEAIQQGVTAFEQGQPRTITRRPPRPVPTTIAPAFGARPPAQPEQLALPRRQGIPDVRQMMTEASETPEAQANFERRERIRKEVTAPRPANRGAIVSAMLEAISPRDDQREIESRVQAEKAAEAERNRLLSQFTDQDRAEIANFVEHLKGKGSTYTGFRTGARAVGSSALYKLAGVTDILGGREGNVIGDALRRKALAGELSIEDIPPEQRGQVAEFLTQLGFGLGEIIATPGGPISKFAGLAATESVGRGQTPEEIAKETAKGATIGAVFKGAGRLGHPTQTLGGRARNLATEGAAIGAGTYGVEKTFGTPDEEAALSAATNVALHGVLGARRLRGRPARQTEPETEAQAVAKPPTESVARDVTREVRPVEPEIRRAVEPDAGPREFRGKTDNELLEIAAIRPPKGTKRQRRLEILRTRDAAIAEIERRQSERVTEAQRVAPPDTGLRAAPTGEVPSFKVYVENRPQGGIRFETLEPGSADFNRLAGEYVERYGTRPPRPAEPKPQVVAPEPRVVSPVEARPEPVAPEPVAPIRQRPARPPAEPEPPAPVTEPTVTEAVRAARTPQPTGIARVPVSELNVDADRFQYKIQRNARGGTGSLAGVRQWSPNLEGVTSVWRDPVDGKTYVVNGHNRYEKARELGVEDLTVRYIDAPDAKSARIIGAEINIAEGQGTAIDAAKFFKDSKLTADDLRKRGIPLERSIAKDGLALSKLDDFILNAVIRGELPQEYGVAIGSKITNPDLQAQAYKAITKASEKGKTLNKAVVDEMLDAVGAAPRQTQLEQSLFGDFETERSLFNERAQVAAAIKRHLAGDKSLFGTAARKSTRLAEGGTRVDVEQAKALQESAAEALGIFDTLKNRTGGISNILDAGAKKVAEGQRPDAVAKEAYEQIRGAVNEALGRREGPDLQGGVGAHQRTEGEGSQRPLAGASGKGEGDLFAELARKAEPAKAAIPELQRFADQAAEIRQRATAPELTGFERGAMERKAGRLEAKARGEELRRAGAEPDELIDEIIIRGGELYRQKIRPTFEEWARKLREEFGPESDKHVRRVWSGLTGERELSSTAAKREAVTIDREARGEEPIARPERKADETLLADAKAANETDRSKPLRLAEQVLERPFALSDTETVQLDLRKQELKNEYSRVMRDVGNATDPAVIRHKGAEADAIEREMDTLEQAWGKSGTEKGRALRAQRVEIDQDFSLLSMIQTAKKAKGRDLTPRERSRYEAIEKERDAAIADRDAALEKLHARALQKEIDKTSRQRKRSDTRATLDAEAEVIRANIAAEFAKLKAQASSIHSMGGLGSLDPNGVITRELLRFARNRAKAHVGLKAQELIDEAHGLVREFGVTRRQVAEALSGYGRIPIDRRSEAAKQLADIRREITKTLKQEDIEAGRRSARQEGPKRDLTRNQTRLKQLQAREAEWARKLEAREFEPPAPRQPYPYSREVRQAEDRALIAEARFRREMEREKPGHQIRNLSGIMKSWLLSGPPTQAMNIIGTGTYQAFREASRLPAVIADGAWSGARQLLGRGAQRSITGPSPSAMLESVVQAYRVGGRDFVQRMRFGATREEMERHQWREIDFGVETGVKAIDSGVKVIELAHNAVFRFMGASDRVFYQMAYKRNLIDRATVQAKNEGAKSVRARARELTENPPETLDADARHDALKATFNNNNRLTTQIKRFRSAVINKEGLMSRAGAERLNAAENLALDFLIPFDRTPTNVVSRIVEASPAGYIKNAAQLVAAAMRHSMPVEHQRQMMQTFGNATAGTALIGLGWYMAGKGLITVDEYDVFLNLPGLPEINLRTTSPTGNVLAVGARLLRAHEGEGGAGSYVKPASQEILNIPILKAGQPIVDVLHDPERSIPKTGARIASMAVPFGGAMRWAGKVIDPEDERDLASRMINPQSKRLPRGFKEQIQQNFPVWREQLPVTRSEVFRSRTSATPAIKELDRLGMRMDGPKQTEGETRTQYHERRKLTNDEIARQVEILVALPVYSQLSDEEKRKQLRSIATKVNRAYRGFRAANEEENE